jgi:hypothetical protein
MQLSTREERIAEFIANAYGMRPSVADKLATYAAKPGNIDGFAWRVTMLQDAAAALTNDLTPSAAIPTYQRIADESVATLISDYPRSLESM